jgi:RimJ/RimL family protein N-acetyltransferase
MLVNLGFKREGTLRQRHHYAGQFLDEIYYGILRTEWMDRSNLESSIGGSKPI